MDSMARSETPEPAGADQSLGDLVALAAKDVSQLFRYEIDLAKTELREDVRRISVAVVLVGGAAFAGCLVLVILCFAYAEGLHAAFGLPMWAAFLIVAGTLVLLSVIAVGIAVLRVRNMTGLSKTRKTVTEGLGMLRNEIQHPDGQRPEITAAKTR
jgi:ABC-type siderophore export system fused ATPase/permease subunit